jgi:hypothetical protein
MGLSESGFDHFHFTDKSRLISQTGPSRSQLCKHLLLFVTAFSLHSTAASTFGKASGPHSVQGSWWQVC